VAAVALLLCLGGCTLAPTWQQPPLALPATLDATLDATAAAAPTTAPLPALTGAEENFVHAFAPDRDLAPLVARALRHNADFRLALLQVEQARAAYGIAQAARLATVGAQLQGRRLQFDDAALQERYQQHLKTAGLGIDAYELDFFGRLKAQSDAARERYLASDAGREAARAALVAEVLRAYVAAIGAARTRTHYLAIDADSAALLAVAQRQAQVGLIARDDLDRIRTQADRARAAAVQAASDAAAAQRALQILAGYDLATVGGTLEPLADAAAAPAPWRAQPSTVLLRRPDVRQAELELRAAHADIGAARAAFFPSIQLSTSAGSASGALHGLFAGGSGFWSFTPQIDLPLFDFGRRQANLDLAWNRRQAGVAQYEKVVEAAFREVADALDAHAPLAVAERQLREQGERDARRLERMGARAAQGLQDRPALLAERIEAARSALEHLGAQQRLVLNRVALFHAFYGIPPSSD